MYYKSVRFYKHLILGAIAFVFIFLVSAVIFLSVKVVECNETIKQLEEQISEMQIIIDSNTSAENNDTSVDNTDLAIPSPEMKYPTLYTEKPSETINTPNTVYLTFDDGPTAYTDAILDILAEKGVKATFFVVGNQVVKYPETVKRIADEGHAIGLHSDTHNYASLYASVDSFLLEYENCLKKIQSITDYPVTTVRFAGGTNTPYAAHIAPTLVEEITSRGYAIFDWNVDSGDSSSSNVTSAEIVSNIVSGCTGKDVSIVLMHDTKQATVDALGETIDILKSMGFQFGVLSNEIEPMQFRVG